jgi:hypothetical protein
MDLKPKNTDNGSIGAQAIYTFTLTSEGGYADAMPPPW